MKHTLFNFYNYYYYYIIIMESLKKIFFGKENIKKIQKKIKEKIYEKTNGRVVLTVDQEELDLLIIMNNIFSRFTIENADVMTKQIHKLNSLVVKAVVPEMIINIRQSYGYSNKIDKISEPLPLPINANRAGRKTLPSITTTF